MSDVAATMTTSIDVHCGAFRFFDLPAELQHHILLLTDLVAPDRKLSWNPKYGWRLTMILIEELCLEHTPFPSEGHSHGWIKNRRPIDHTMSMTKPAHTRAQWLPPADFFLVSRAFRQASQRIYFGENAITVHPDCSRWNQYEMTDGQLPVSLYFSLFKDCIRHHRYLKIVFPGVLLQFPETYFDCSTKAWDQWNKSAVAIEDELQPHNLTVHVIFANPYSHDNNELSSIRDAFRHAITDPTSMYADALKPIEHLSRLKRLFVHLPCFDLAESVVSAAEEVLERQVMSGKYLAVSCKKPARIAF